MLRHITFAVCMASLPCAMAATERHETVVHFEKDRHELTPAAIALLDELLARVDARGDHHFALDGHTDSDGSTGYNEALALARAEAVRDHLLARGVAASHISVSASGETAPVASNRNEEEMALNRRVTVVFERHWFEGLDALRSALGANTVQQFIIDPEKEALLEATGGTTLHFPAECLVDAAGRPAKGKITVELLEALDMKTCMAQGLSTSSSGRILETGGMMRVNAKDERGNELALRYGTEVRITVPTAAPRNDMELFLSDNDGGDWRPVQRPVAVAEPMTAWIEGPRIPAPTWRRMGIPDLKVPQYAPDLATRPRRPFPPVAPQAPVAPDKDAYSTYVPWWRFWQRAAANRAADVRFAQAMDRHAQRMKRHDQRMERYIMEMEEHPGNMERFKTELAAWEEREKERYANWCTEVRDKAMEDHERTVRAIMQLNDSLVNGRDGNGPSAMERWTAMRDSLMAQWREDRTQQLERWTRQVDNGAAADMQDLNIFVAATGQLGWINIDRFYNTPEEQMRDLIVQDNAPGEKQVAVVFADTRTILQMKRNMDRYEQRIPADARVKVFAYAVIDGRPHLSLHDVEGGATVELDLKPSTLREIAERLKELG